ncbi:hypothetical protein ACGFNU_33115 [Spirillospora sp. NPDC048911]|uniref:hypothetical protein n=1 Tax=Spirillospora sp. NPDC048911 TaxID=3364527 RepID=UPI0037240D17
MNMAKGESFSMRIFRLAAVTAGVTAVATMLSVAPASAGTGVFFSSSLLGGQQQINDPEPGPCYTVAVSSLSAYNRTRLVAHVYPDPSCSLSALRVGPGNHVGTVYTSVSFSAE